MKSATPDAIDQLDADHLAVHGLFQSYRELVRTGAPALQRRALAEEICLELTIHARLEEEIFYPAVRRVLRPEVLDEAEEQHGSQREFIAQILVGTPDDELYDARVRLLEEYVERHVAHERESVFNRVLASHMDLQGVGRSLAQRREELRNVSEALREEALASALA